MLPTISPAVNNSLLEIITQFKSREKKKLSKEEAKKGRDGILVNGKTEKVRW